MEGSLQNKLLKHEVVPPPAVWEKLSFRLNEEFIPSDALLSSRVENASVTPPPAAWSHISASLHGDSSDNIITGHARVIPLVYKRIAVAAVVAGLIAISAFYFLNNDTANPTVTNTVAANNNAAAIPAPSIQPSSDTNAEPSKTLIAGNRVKRSAFARTVSASRRNALTADAPYFTYAELEMEPRPVLQTAAPVQPVEVEAPPIRDERGNIIMDLSVINNPGNPYIAVTSPNGLQTRISKKFLNCLSYLNGDFSSSEISNEGQQWKTRFEEWRNKLLSEGAFVPAASNFFDIFELKALIEEQ